jgi:hypothetical protein
MLFDKNIFLFLIFSHIINYLQEIYLVCSYFFLFSPGAACFFAKHVETGNCIQVKSGPQVTAPWGKLFGVELSNNCLDPAVQFRFLENSAMFNLERKSCFEGKLSVLYFLLATNHKSNCVQKHAITQTSWGGLSVYDVHYKQTRCAFQKTNSYIGLTDCSDTADNRFNFGKFLGYIFCLNCSRQI